MKRLFLILVLLFSLLNASFSQKENEDYQLLIKEAKELYKEKKFDESGRIYNKAFRKANSNIGINDRYDAACSWSLASKNKNAFTQLFKIANQGNYSNYNHLTKDIDLINLHSVPKWVKLERLVKINQEKAEAKLDKDLILILDTILKSDQIPRLELEKMGGEYGWDSEEVKKQWLIIHTSDSTNLIKVEQIIQKYGWLGADIIGRNGNQTLFLVIQHSNQITQEKYLPLMRSAVSNGNANPQDLALLEDRVALGQGKKQIYGSQIGMDKITGKFYVLPLENPDKVDERRKKMGLTLLSEYLKNSFQLEWDVNAYKKELPDIIERIKKQ